MLVFNYEDIIEYVDGTLDPTFTSARNWAREHNTTFEELLNKRNLPKRYFQIGPEPVQPEPEPVQPEPQPVPPEPTPTEYEKKAEIRFIRDRLLRHTDFTQLEDVPFTEEEKARYREYRQYLRDYTKQKNWWLQEPDDWDTWLLSHYPVTEEE